MRPILCASLVGLLWLGLSSPARPQTSISGPPNQILCNRAAIMAVGPTTAQQLVAPISQPVSMTIYICGWHVNNTGPNGTFTITTGTQTTTPCDTGTTAITPALNVSSTAPSTDHQGFAITQSNRGDGLCFTPSVGTIAAIVYYAQFP